MNWKDQLQALLKKVEACPAVKDDATQVEAFAKGLEDSDTASSAVANIK